MFFSKSLSLQHQKVCARLERQQVSIVSSEERYSQSANVVVFLSKDSGERARCCSFLWVLFTFWKRKKPPHAHFKFISKNVKESARTFLNAHGGLLFIYSGEIYTRTTQT